MSHAVRMSYVTQQSEMCAWQNKLTHLYGRVNGGFGGIFRTLSRRVQQAQTDQTMRMTVIMYVCRFHSFRAEVTHVVLKSQGGETCIWAL